MKLKFVYSSIYDNMLSEMSGKDFTATNVEDMLIYKKDIEDSWKKDEKKIIRDIEKFSGLKFKGDKNCFLVGDMIYTAISNPMTLKKHSNMKRTKTILVHELIHKLLEDNRKKVSNLIIRAYPEKSFEFKLHVPVLLITKKVIEKSYGKETLNRVIKDEMGREILSDVWPEVNRLSDKFRKDIIKFLKNENIH